MGLGFGFELEWLDWAHSPDTFEWSMPNVKGTIPSPRSGHKMCAVDGKLFSIGGGSKENWDQKFNDVYVFDPATSTWSKPQCTGSLDVCTFPACWTVGRFIFLFGL